MKTPSPGSAPSQPSKRGGPSPDLASQLDPTSPSSPIPMLTVEGTRKLLNCSCRHVRRLVDSGKMPAPIKLGRISRWPAQVIDEWIAGGWKPVRTVNARRAGK